MIRELNLTFSSSEISKLDICCYSYYTKEVLYIFLNGDNTTRILMKNYYIYVNMLWRNLRNWISSCVWICAWVRWNSKTSFFFMSISSFFTYISYMHILALNYRNNWVWYHQKWPWSDLWNIFCILQGLVCGHII